ncbi:MAG: sugar phosphate isomerase/epimerase family protein [Spirosomataceae bacterium]
MTTNRRDFLKKAGALTMGSALFSAPWQATTAKSAFKNIGVQLFTAMSALDNDVPGTLKAIAQAGYTEIESAFSRKGGYYGMTAKEFSVFAKDLGLSWKSHHIGGAARPPQANAPSNAPRPAMKNLRDHYQEVVDDMAEAGVPYLVCSSTPIKTLDEVKRSIEVFQKAGEACQKAGIVFGFHNHSAEFELVEGVKPFDLMAKELSPDILKFELDVAWAMKAGVDPVALFKAHPKRFPLLHVKDLEKGTFKPVEIGAGYLDYSQVFAHAKTAGVKHLFVEQDGAPEPVKNLQNSITHLRKWLS